MMFWSFLIVMSFWFAFGLAQKRTHHKRGTTLVTGQELKKLIRRNRKASHLKLRLKFWRKLPLLKNKETSHMLITGTTGSGKTNAFHSLLPQIRKKGHPAIIVDITGDYVARYYNPETDIILNPLDTCFLIKATTSGLEKIFKEGLCYKKAGVQVMSIVPEAQNLPTLFTTEDFEDSPKRKVLLKTMDTLNHFYGNGTLVFASEGIRKSWTSKALSKSLLYTQRWDQLMTVGC